MNIKHYLTLFVLLLFSTELLAADDRKLGAGSNRFYFEQSDVPQVFSSQNSQLSISDYRFKDGKQSLKWQLDAKGATLTVAHPVGFLAQKMKRAQYFVANIYNEKPVREQMLFSFYKDGEKQAEFSYRMNFSGWRVVSVSLTDVVVKGKAVADMDKLVISAPDTLHKKSIYLDRMLLSQPMDKRWSIASYQMPKKNPTSIDSENQHWTALIHYDRWLRKIKAGQGATEQEQAAIEQMIERIDQDLLSKGSAPSKSTLKKISKQYGALNLIRNPDGTITGTPIEQVRNIQELQYAPELSAEEKQFLEKGSIRLSNVSRLLRDLAIAYRYTRHPKKKKQLLTMFLLANNHLTEQGWVRGSGQGRTHHQGYSVRELMVAYFLMREPLAKYKQLKNAAGFMGWITGLGRINEPKNRINGFNVDVMNTMIGGMLYSILMMEDGNTQIAYLRQFSEWVNYSLPLSRGLAGGIKPDGSFFHHKMHYPAYGRDGLKGFTPVAYYINETPFELNKQSREVLHRAVLAYRLFSNDGLVLMSLSGRHPTGKQKILDMPFKYMALMGNAETGEKIDREMADIYLSLANLKRDKNAERLLGDKPDKPPQVTGSWAMNYSGLALHRRADWLAAARGFSRYLYSGENYSIAGNYNRYLNYGQLEILTGDKDKRTFNEQGWDWSRWPGTTTIYLPTEKVAAQWPNNQGMTSTEMLHSDETYSGANQLNGESAMFAMKLHEHPKYNDSHRARKSVFFFDDRIIALGSDIENDDQFNETETTLFQDYLSSASTPIYLKNEKLSGLELSKNITTDQGFYLLDVNQNGFYLPPGQQLLIERKHQHSRENKKKNPTEGDFATAVIRHGKAPKGQSYQYAVLVEAGEQRAKEFASAMTDPLTAPYTVLQQNRDAHIVYDRATATTAYALFEAGGKIAGSLIKAVDTPVMLMSQLDSTALTVSMVDPNLNLYSGKARQDKDWYFNDSAATVVRLSLKGSWRVKGESDQYRIVSVLDGVTKVEVVCRDGQPVLMSFLANK